MAFQPPPGGVGAPPRGGFFSTLPGILTASAAVITAVSGGLGLYVSRDAGGSGGGTADYNITVQAAPAPDVSAEADPVAVAQELGGMTVDDQVDAVVADCAAGYADACATLLDLLVEECYEGFGLSCDALYWISPVGSDYEAYGATCGGRYGVEYAGVCGEL